MTDSVPSEGLQILRTLRRAVTAAATVRTLASRRPDTTTDQERALLDLIDLVVKYINLMVTPFRAQTPEERIPVLASLSLLLKQKMEDVEAVEGRRELEALMKETGFADMLEMIDRFDVVEHLAGGGSTFAGIGLPHDPDDEEEEEGGSEDKPTPEEEAQMHATCVRIQQQTLAEHGIEVSTETADKILRRGWELVAEAEEQSNPEQPAAPN